jgi:hypothetical protein
MGIPVGQISSLIVPPDVSNLLYPASPTPEEPALDLKNLSKNLGAFRRNSSTI